MLSIFMRGFIIPALILSASAGAQTPTPASPTPTPTMSCNFDYYTELHSSTLLLEVGQTITIDVSFHDDTGECHMALYDFTLYQHPAGDPFFSPASFHDGPPGQTTYQISLTAIRPGQTRLAGSYYGELYQGYWHWTTSTGYTPWITILPAPTPTEAATPAPPPTPTQPPTSTPGCPETGIDCVFNQAYYGPGDPFDCLVTACNGTENDLAVDIYILLEVGGSYFFWPSWSPFIDRATFVLPECGCLTILTMSFIWPEELAPFTARMYGAMFESGTYNLLDLAICAFASRQD